MRSRSKRDVVVLNSMNCNYKGGINMREQLTKSDVKKIEQEIEYRKLVVRKEAL